MMGYHHSSVIIIWLYQFKTCFRKVPKHNNDERGLLGKFLLPLKFPCKGMCLENEYYNSSEYFFF